MGKLSDGLLPIEVVTKFTQTIPVDLDGLAKELGIAVKRRRLSDDSISGKIECERNGPCVITINALHSPRRQRFTLAHELAHYIFHRDIIGDGIVDDAIYRSNQSNRVERQANRFAAELLMPAHSVVDQYKAGARTPNAMAEIFKVSPAVAEIRLKELAYRLGG